MRGGAPSAMRTAASLVLGLPAGVAVGASSTGGCDSHPPATYVMDAGPPISPLDAALFSQRIPVVEALPPGPAPPPAFPRDGGDTFEGVIDLTLLTPAMKLPPLKVQLFVKGDRAAMVASGKAGVIREVFEPRRGGAFEVRDVDRTFERVPLDALTPDMVVTRGTTQETIAGAPCEDWTIRSTSGVSRACVTRGLGPYLFRKTFTVALPWSAALVPDGFFALRATLEGKDGGADVQSLTVTKVTPQAVPDDTFTWPDDYQDARTTRRTSKPDLGHAP